MDHHTAAIIEAVRLARLELECYRDPICRATPEWTVNRLSQILLEDSVVSMAMTTLIPEAPSLAPEDIHAVEAAH